MFSSHKRILGSVNYFTTASLQRVSPLVYLQQDAISNKPHSPSLFTVAYFLLNMVGAHVHIWGPDVNTSLTCRKSLHEMKSLQIGRFFLLPFCLRTPGPATLVGGGIQGQPELLKQLESAEAMGQGWGRHVLFRESHVLFLIAQPS